MRAKLTHIMIYDILVHRPLKAITDIHRYCVVSLDNYYIICANFKQNTYPSVGEVPQPWLLPTQP